MDCDNCGRVNPFDATFCASCGVPFSGDIAGPPDLRFAIQPQPEAVSLEPKTLVELVKETFLVYRTQFAAFIIIASAPQIAISIGFVVAPPASIIWLVAGILLSFITNAAGSWAVGQHYRDDAVSIPECFERAMRKALPLVLAGIIIGLSLAGSVVLTVILVGFLLLPFLFVSWFFTFDIILYENFPALEALGRSRELVSNFWWRTFGALIAFVVLLFGISFLAGIVTAVAFVDNLIAGAIASAIVNVLISPIFVIAGTLLYFDLRVRREAFDVARLSSDMDW